MENTQPQTTPIPAEVIGYYSTRDSSIPLISKMVKLVGILSICMPLSWMMMMLLVNEVQRFSQDRRFGYALNILSGLVDVPMIILGILFLMRFNRSLSLLILSWITLFITWISFGLLVFRELGFTLEFSYTLFLIAGMCLSLTGGLYAIIHLLHTLRASPEFKTFMR